ncbi:MAG TPA: right-handed parallel beta-helix repeat-containing protein [Gemmatimonadaceae bacterium]|nr:right-handed parallel beta-helix repeat-containing protein [Gemmatimonadaceae bacterium]
MRRLPSLLATLALPWVALPSVARPAVAQPAPTVVPRPGLVIARSVRVQPGTYHLSAPTDPDSALIVVRGDDVTVDMRGVTLVGAPEAAEPDEATGVAVRVAGGRNVTVRGATIRGYRVAILAEGTRGLTLVDNDVSHTWKPRLFSLIQHESLVDWLSYHKNEADEWRRFGAGIYLADVRGGEIRGNTAEQGMNGLLMTRTDSLLVWNNVFSFNSGLGIGMYRSSHNRILHNRADYDVRGYSHGFYRRGQDSAALLMFEQCTHNVVAYNSMTHGGDGLFLWAGQQTMDTGQGGGNDNLFYGNDFSYAPTNGMEATFSRNTFAANRVWGSDHGLWGGYSYESRVIGNDFRFNRIGIAIEHGQGNAIVGNTFTGDSTAISLWANPIEPSDWGYPKHRDTRSRDYRIVGNVFAEHRVGVRAANTSGLVVTDNVFTGVDSATVIPDSTGLTLARNRTLTHLAPDSLPEQRPYLDSLLQLVRPLTGARIMPWAEPLSTSDRRTIVVDAWGPYDWRSPKLWPADSGRGATIRLQVLGPEAVDPSTNGTWRVVERRGIARLSRERGRVPDTIVVTPAADAAGDWALMLEYRGAATESPRGERRAAGVPYRFAYEHFAPRIEWRERWFAWSDSTRDPQRDSAAFLALLRGTPALERRTPRLDVEGYGPPVRGLPAERVALEATGTVTLPAGAYTLRTISDDAIRVWVDGRLAIDAWAPHESAVSYAALGGGPHELRVQYVQLGGWHELRLDVLRGAVRHSEGSPGPH